MFPCWAGFQQASIGHVLEVDLTDFHQKCVRIDRHTEGACNIMNFFEASCLPFCLSKSVNFERLQNRTATGNVQFLPLEKFYYKSTAKKTESHSLYRAR